LKFHLAPAGFRIAQFAQPDGEAVELRGDYAEVVVAAPFHAVFQIALRNAMGIAGYSADGAEHKEDGGQLNEKRCQYEDVCHPRLARSYKGGMGYGHQPHSEASKQHTAEDKSLGKIEQKQVSVVAGVTSLFSRIWLVCAKYWFKTSAELARVLWNLANSQGIIMPPAE
jgi:hypothetical protein